MLTSPGAERVELTPGVKLFHDRDYTLAMRPDALSGATFLRMPLEGLKTLTCAKPGIVTFATPGPERHPPTTQAARLKAQGFEKVALPEFQFFGRNPQAKVTLFQKHCEAGEVIEVGAWAVPIFLPLAK